MNNGINEIEGADLEPDELTARQGMPRPEELAEQFTSQKLIGLIKIEPWPELRNIFRRALAIQIVKLGMSEGDAWTLANFEVTP